MAYRHRHRDRHRPVGASGGKGRARMAALRASARGDYQVTVISLMVTWNGRPELR
jgi:hypothetical protein